MSIACGLQKAYGQQWFLTAYGDKRASGNPVNAIIQDANGFIWLGTDNGLEYFDGIRCTPYSESKVSGKITSFFQGTDGNIYCGGEFGLAILPQNPNFDTSQILLKHSKTGNEPGIGTPESLFEDSKGRLWIGGIKGQYCMKDRR